MNIDHIALNPAEVRLLEQSMGDPKDPMGSFNQAADRMLVRRGVQGKQPYELLIFPHRAALRYQKV